MSEISLIDDEYMNAKKIVEKIQKYDITQTPLIVIYIGKHYDIISNTLKMTIFLLKEKRMPVVEKLISDADGAEVLEWYLKEQDKKLVVYDSLISYGMRKDGRLYKDYKLQCEKIFELGYSVISYAPPYRIKNKLKRVINELHNIGFMVEIIFENIPQEKINYLGFNTTPSVKAKSLYDRARKLIKVSLSNEVPFNEPRYDYVPIYLGNTYVAKLDLNDKRTTRSGWWETKILICPNCFKSITLGRDHENVDFLYDSHRAYFGYNELKVKSERGFKQHIKRCKPAFAGDGIWEVENEKQKEIAEKFARFSRREAGWDFPLITTESFNEGAKAFIFVDNGLPKGYVAFNRLNLDQFGEIYVLWDVYSFPAFRKKGIATKLIQYGINVLKIDKDYFGVSFPVRKVAHNIVLNNVGKYILAVEGNSYQKIEKKKLKEIWNS